MNIAELLFCEWSDKEGLRSKEFKKCDDAFEKILENQAMGVIIDETLPECLTNANFECNIAAAKEGFCAGFDKGIEYALEICRRLWKIEDNV